MCSGSLRSSATELKKIVSVWPLSRKLFLYSPRAASVLMLWTILLFYLGQKDLTTPFCLILFLLRRFRRIIINPACKPPAMKATRKLEIIYSEWEAATPGPTAGDVKQATWETRQSELYANKCWCKPMKANQRRCSHCKKHAALTSKSLSETLSHVGEGTAEPSQQCLSLLSLMSRCSCSGISVKAEERSETVSFDLDEMKL